MLAQCAASPALAKRQLAAASIRYIPAFLVLQPSLSLSKDGIILSQWVQHFSGGIPLDGNSMRLISLAGGVPLNPVTKRLIKTGETCAAYPTETVRNVALTRVGRDEIWSFC